MQRTTRRSPRWLPFALTAFLGSCETPDPVLAPVERDVTHGLPTRIDLLQGLPAYALDRIRSVHSLVDSATVDGSGSVVLGVPEGGLVIAVDEQGRPFAAARRGQYEWLSFGWTSTGEALVQSLLPESLRTPDVMERIRASPWWEQWVEDSIRNAWTRRVSYAEDPSTLAAATKIIRGVLTDPSVGPRPKAPFPVAWSDGSGTDLDLENASFVAFSATSWHPARPGDPLSRDRLVPGRAMGVTDPPAGRASLPAIDRRTTLQVGFDSPGNRALVGGHLLSNVLSQSGAAACGVAPVPTMSGKPLLPPNDPRHLLREAAADVQALGDVILAEMVRLCPEAVRPLPASARVVLQAVSAPLAGFELLQDGRSTVPLLRDLTLLWGASRTADVCQTEGAVHDCPDEPVSFVTVDVDGSSLRATGDTVRAVATPMDEYGRTMSSRVRWGSSNPGVADVTPAGVVTAISPGMTVLTAESGGVESTAGVTIALDDPPQEARVWDALCYSGDPHPPLVGFGTCVRVRAWAWEGPEGKELVIEAQNLQGSLGGAFDTATDIALAGLTLRAAPPDGFGTGLVRYDGRPMVDSLRGPVEIAGRPTWSIVRHTAQEIVLAGWLVGCGRRISPAGFQRTCPAEGLDGVVHLRIRLASHDWSLDRMILEARFVGSAGKGLGGLTCDPSQPGTYCREHPLAAVWAGVPWP